MPGLKQPDINYNRKDVLPDGREIIIRAIRPTDKEAILKGFRRLSKASIHSRFFAGKHDLSKAELKFLTEVDFKTHVAIGVELKEEGIPVGVGRFIRNKVENELSADIAITIDEEHHNRGIGKIVFRHLTEIAIQLGYELLTADVLTTNGSMLHIIDSLGYPVKKKIEGDYIKISLILSR